MGNPLARCVFAAALSLVAFARADVVRLDELPLDTIRQDWGQPHANKSVEANAISIAGKSFEHGIGTHANSTWFIELDGKAERFTASVGVDDEVSRAPQSKQLMLAFKVYGDEKLLWQSPIMKGGDAPAPVDVDLHGQKKITLVVMTAGGTIDYAHADWADAAITFAGARPKPVELPAEPKEILTPKPKPEPLITGASVFGVRPGHPILFTATATGDKPIDFTANGLPEGVTFDPITRQFSGSVAKAGTYEIKLAAKNDRGESRRVLKLVVGDKIALTPPMGFNSWNCFAEDVSDAKIRAAVDSMISTGLADHGWTYINIDDCYQVNGRVPREKRRDANNRMLTNEKFPDMKALTDYIHAKGFKAGIYSSPGVTTCGNFEGSLNHELDDAKQYAEWGFDYLKYDWCSYGQVADEKLRATNDPAEKRKLYMAPYVVMQGAIAQQPRDIVYSLCQYGWDHVWEWGADVNGQLWRTTGDISDNWSSMSGIGFNQIENQKFAGPGHWNDPDMLVVGKVGWGPKLHDTHLTPNEQYTHITLWSLLSAPMLIGCDLTQLDDFTLSLLTNDEVLAVNQDPLGEQAHRVSQDKEHNTEVWSKKLEDGSLAVGLFNRGEITGSVHVSFAELGLTGKQQVRDLWRQRDVTSDADGYTVSVNRHGAALIRIAPAH